MSITGEYVAELVCLNSCVSSPCHVFPTRIITPDNKLYVNNAIYNITRGASVHNRTMSCLLSGIK